ncbi:MAG: heavy metal translocating P-type ATPase [Phycisphaerae bacterium]
MPQTFARVTSAFSGEARPRDRFMLTAGCGVLGIVGYALMNAGHSRAAAAAITLAYLLGGLRTTVEAVRSLREGMPDINFLMIFAAVVSAALGYWDEGALLLFLFSLSDALERYAIERTRGGIRALMGLRPATAHVLRGEIETTIAIERVNVGDRLRVRPGERFPVDGAIDDGQTTVDESVLTGESAAVAKSIGHTVFAGTINLDGSIIVRMTRPAAESAIARIVALVESAQENKAAAQRVIERWQTPYVLTVLGVCALTIAGYAIAGVGVAHAIQIGMILLVAASPCAVVLASPVAVLAAVTRGARIGVLFKGGAHLERLSNIDTLALDKTGTLTLGKPRVTQVRATSGTEAELLLVAASVEAHSEHPLAKAVVAEAATRGVQPVEVRDFVNRPGYGVVGVINGRRCVAGRAALFDELGIALPAELRSFAKDKDGQTYLLVWREGGPMGVITLADEIRPGAAEALRRIHAMGVRRVVMLTGDHEGPARRVAAALGIDEVRASLLPEDKLRHVRELAEHGGVAMVGDGVNDAPALAAATVGVAMGHGGSDVALETADVVLMRDDLNRLADAVEIARRSRATIQQSLTFAFAVIAVLVLLTLTGVLTLPLAVVGHEGSTVLVVLNGLRLLRSNS